MEVLVNSMVVIILEYMCIQSTHCTPETYTMLYVSYISIKLETPATDDYYCIIASLGMYDLLSLIRLN